MHVPQRLLELVVRMKCYVCSNEIEKTDFNMIAHLDQRKDIE